MKKVTPLNKLKDRFRKMAKTYSKYEGKTLVMPGGTTKVVPPKPTITAQTKAGQSSQYRAALKEMHGWIVRAGISRKYENKYKYDNAWDNFVNQLFKVLDDAIRDKMQKNPGRFSYMWPARDNAKDEFDALSDNARVKGGKLIQEEARAQNNFYSTVFNAVLPSDEEQRTAYLTKLREMLKALEKVNKALYTAVKAIYNDIYNAMDWTEEMV